MNIVFMGTPDFAVTILEKLITEHTVLAVITQPDKPKGRGKKLVFPPVKEFAIENNITVLQPLKIKEQAFIEELKTYNADVFVVAAYGQILPKEVLYMPRFGSINVHGSLLPKYRGAAPIQWAVIDGEKVTGVTIMQMDEGLDTGDILLKKEFEITPQDTAGSVFEKMGTIGADALLEALELINSGKAERIKQENSLSSYAGMITKETGRINWSNSCEQIINLIRGLNPLPGAYTSFKGDILKIWKAERIMGYTCADDGEILDIINNKGVVVKAGDGTVLITEVQGVGGKKMPMSDYLRGHSLDVGELFL